MLRNPDGVLDCLSDRERETLDLLLQLGRQKSVAERIALSPKTVNAYVVGIERKFGVKGAIELTRYCIRKGIIDA